MTLYSSQMLNQVKFWYKKCFANNNNDSRITEIAAQCKVRSVSVINGKERFTFYIFYCVKFDKKLKQKSVW